MHRSQIILYVGCAALFQQVIRASGTGVWATTFAIAAWVSPLAHSQTVDKVAQSLDRARVAYERAMEDTRQDVLRALKAKLNAAGREGTAAVKQVGEELDAFNATGEWPDVPQLEQLRNRAARAAKTVKDAYAKALAEYTQQDKTSLREALTTESDQFESQSDIVPWGDNLVANLSIDQRTIAAAGEPVSFDCPVKGPYRLEILAKRNGEAGNLWATIPAGDGKRVKIPLFVSADGSVHTLVTISERGISADLGTARPIDRDGAASPDGTGLVITINGSDAVIQSVRVKPVIDGEPEMIAERSRTNAKERPSVNDGAPVGSRWAGTFHNSAGGHAATAEVISADGNRIVFRVSIGDYGTRDWDFAISGKSLSLTECRNVKTTGGAILKSPRISGTIEGGKLNVSGSWVWQLPKKGGGEKIRLELTAN